MKKILGILAILTIAIFTLAGCGQQASKGGGSGAGKITTIKVGATPVPHAELLEKVKPILEKQGIKLEIVEFNDYVQPNLALNDGDIDANFFQHKPYLDNFVKEHPEMKLANVAGIHIEPMGIYSHKVKNLNDLKDGSLVAIPNDPTNGGRSLLLLEKAGVIKLREGAGVEATVKDIAENPKHLQFKEVEAAQVPRTLDDVTIAVINTNFAMQVNLVPTKDALFIEDSTSPYVNILVVKNGSEDRPEIQALIKALQSQEIKDFINEKYKGQIVAAF